MNPLNLADPGFFKPCLDYVVQLDQGVWWGSTFISKYVEIFGLLKVPHGYNIFGNWVFTFFSRRGKVKYIFNLSFEFHIGLFFIFHRSSTWMCGHSVTFHWWWYLSGVSKYDFLFSLLRFGIGSDWSLFGRGFTQYFKNVSVIFKSSKSLAQFVPGYISVLGEKGFTLFTK